MESTTLIWTEWLMVAVFVAGVLFWGFHMRKSASSLDEKDLTYDGKSTIVFCDRQKYWPFIALYGIIIL